MSLTEDKYDVVKTQKNLEFKDDGVEINLANPFLQQDLGIIINAFERECQNWSEEDYAKAYLYRDVYSTEDFAHRTREQMDYYPGMHQSDSPPQTDPLYTEGKKKANQTLKFWNNSMDNSRSFMSGLESREGDFDYGKIFGRDASKQTRAENLGKILTECIPCFDRLLDMDSLLPDGDLLEIHAMNIKVRTDILDKVSNIFDDPGMYVDICQLLKMFTRLCPQDLLGIIVLLSQYLAKINLEINFNLDFVIQLIGPMLSPFLDAFSGWIDKWIQLFLKPQICVLDHINETILLAQQAKIPFSEVGANVGLKSNAALPLHNNIATSGRFGVDAGLGDSDRYAFDDGRDRYAGAWSEYDMEAFNTPQEQRYNPEVPEVPREETELAFEEIKTAWSPGISEEERSERDRRWRALRAEQKARVQEVPAPLKTEKRDGTRWSKDDIPNSEKFQSGGSWEAGYFPPEKQVEFKAPTEYFVTTPVIQSVVEVRNILQGGIQYMNDSFEYATQMIYDLLGTDVGWMSKKTDRTILKSKIIQIIYMIKAIFQAMSKNGLECGLNTNYNEEQMRYILEKGMNKYVTGGKAFKVQDDGTVILTKNPLPNVVDYTSDDKEISVGGTPNDTISSDSTVDQASEGFVVIKDCFKSVRKDELDRVKQWIADFEKKGEI